MIFEVYGVSDFRRISPSCSSKFLYERNREKIVFFHDSCIDNIRKSLKKWLLFLNLVLLIMKLFHPIFSHSAGLDVKVSMSYGLISSNMYVDKFTNFKLSKKLVLFLIPKFTILVMVFLFLKIVCQMLRINLHMSKLIIFWFNLKCLRMEL